MVMILDRIGDLEPERICIVKPSSLGDIVHSMPILAALRLAGPLPGSHG